MMHRPEILTDTYSIWFHFQTWDYEIRWDRLEDQNDLITWIEHIAGKRWVTPDVMREFIGAVRAHRGWERSYK